MKRDENMSDERDEQFRKLFVGGLHFETTEKELTQYFEQFGEIIDTIVMKDPATQRSRGFGFITFKTADALDEAQNARPHRINNKEVETKRAMPREESGRPDMNVVSKKLYVSGVKDGLDESDLKEYFSRFGGVEAVEIIVDKMTGQRRGFAFVTFEDHDPVDKIVLMKSHMINEQRCDVRKALSKEEMFQIKSGDGLRGGRGGGRGGGRVRGGPERRDFGGFGGGKDFDRRGGSDYPPRGADPYDSYSRDFGGYGSRDYGAPRDSYGGRDGPRDGGYGYGGRDPYAGRDSGYGRDPYMSREPGYSSRDPYGGRDAGYGSRDPPGYGSRDAGYRREEYGRPAAGGYGSRDGGYERDMGGYGARDMGGYGGGGRDMHYDDRRPAAGGYSSRYPDSRQDYRGGSSFGSGYGSSSGGGPMRGGDSYSAKAAGPYGGGYSTSSRGGGDGYGSYRR